MRKPNRKEFMEERKFDGKVYKSVNEDAYRTALRKWETFNRKKQRQSY